MKALFFITLLALILSGCNKPEKPPDYKIVNGLYGGQFYYKGITYGYLITLDSNKYIEHLSGGLYLQKWCYTAGTYSIKSEKLVFKLDSLLNNIDTTVYPCNQENLLLPGEYTIDYLKNDSLVFERGEGESWIIYYLKKDSDLSD